MLVRDRIETRVHHPVPLHRQPCARRGAFELPVSEDLANQVLSLPIFPTISHEQVQEVADRLVAAVAGQGR